MHLGKTLLDQCDILASPLAADVTCDNNSDVGASPTLNPFGLNPFGDVEADNCLPTGFDAQALLSEAHDAIPAWQRDTDQNEATNPAASLERQAILKGFSQQNRFGVIFDRRGHVVQGNLGWTNQLNSLATLGLKSNRIVPIAPQSQLEFKTALDVLFQDYLLPSVPVALRDLDGWVCDVCHICRVGPANPNFAYAILPRSSVEIAAILAQLSATLGLSTYETELVGLIAKGNSNREMAAAMNVKLGTIQRGVRQVLCKFKVRQASDIIRILATFP